MPISKLKTSIFKASNVVSAVVIISSIALSVYNYNKLLKVSYLFAEKENEWTQKYQLLQEKLKISADYIEDANQRTQELSQKLEESSKSIHDVQLSIAQMQMLQNSDKLIAMQFKHIITMASEQLKITQDANLVLSTLQEIDERLKSFPSGNWANLHKALTNDILNLKLQPNVDTSSTLDKINKNIALIEQIQFVNLPQNLEKDKNASLGKAWWDKLYQGIWEEFTGLIRVRNINNPNAITLTKNEEWFLKENIKLLLVQAKLAVYNRSQQDFDSYLKQIQHYSNLYIDSENKSATLFNKSVRDLSIVKFATNVNINQTLQAIIEIAQ